MEQISGVAIRVISNGRFIVPEADGFLGRLDSRKNPQVSVSVVVTPESWVYGLSVDKKQNVAFKADLVAKEGLPVNGRMYRFATRVVLSAEGHCRTIYPENHMRLLQIGDNGHVTMYQVAVVSQRGDFFLIVQKMYEGQYYLYKDELGCTNPQLDKWPQLYALMDKFFEDKGLNDTKGLHDYEDDEPPADVQSETVVPMGQGLGVALFFDPAKGFGAIQTAEGAARVYWENLAPRPRLAYLNPGELVTYQEMRNPPTQTHPRPTQFVREALGVQIFVP